MYFPLGRLETLIVLIVSQGSWLLSIHLLVVIFDLYMEALLMILEIYIYIYIYFLGFRFPLWTEMILDLIFCLM